MTMPSSGILDNYNLRWNWGTNQLEMNIGDEEWIVVPGAGTITAAGDPGNVQFNDTVLAANAAFNWDNDALALSVDDGYIRGTGDSYLQLFDVGVDDSANSFIVRPDSSDVTIHSDVGQPTFVVSSGVGGSLIGSFFADAANSTVDIEVTGGKRITLSSTGGMSWGSGNTADASAALDVPSTTLGFLPPRMTSTQRDDISTPTEGLTVYNLSTHTLNFWNGSAWTAV